MAKIAAFILQAFGKIEDDTLRHAAIGPNVSIAASVEPREAQAPLMRRRKEAPAPPEPFVMAPGAAYRLQ